jgi:hypothetical protein
MIPEVTNELFVNRMKARILESFFPEFLISDRRRKSEDFFH